MVQLITDYASVLESPEKIEYLQTHYQSENSILFGLLPATESSYAIARNIIRDFINKQEEGWTKGQFVATQEIEFISHQIHLIEDWYMPDYLQQIKAPDIYETIEQMEQRTGKKCSGSKKSYITVCVSRRFKNPLNHVPPMIDDDDQGLIPANSIKGIDHIIDQN